VAKTREQRINEIKGLIEEWEDTGAMLPGSDLTNKILEVRKRARAERFDPAVNRLGPSGMSPTDMARLNNSYAKLIKEATTYLIGLGDQQIEGNKLRQLKADAIFATVRKAMEARADVKTTAMTQERMAIKDLFDGAKIGIELMSKGLKGDPKTGKSTADVLQDYTLRKADAFQKLLGAAGRNETTKQQQLLAALNPDELEEFLNKWGRGQTDESARQDYTVAELTGYSTIEEAKQHVTTEHNGILGRMSTADQEVIRRFKANELALEDSTTGIADAEIMDEYLRTHIMPEGVETVGSDELAAKLIGFYSVYDPNRLTRLMMDGSQDRLGLIKYLRQSGQFDSGKDLIAVISAANRGDYVSLPDLLDALVGNYGLTDEQRSTNDRIASNIALTQEAALGPRAGMQVNPQTQAWYDIADNPMVQDVMRQTGRTLKQTMNDFVKQSRRQAKLEKRVAAYDFQEQKRAALEAAKKIGKEDGVPAYRRDWLARTVQDVQAEQQRRVNQAVNAGLSSAAAAGDNPNESLETSREEDKVDQTPGEDATPEN